MRPLHLTFCLAVLAAALVSGCGGSGHGGGGAAIVGARTVSGTLSTATASATTVPADGTSIVTLTVTAMSPGGQPVSGATVKFSASGTGNLLTSSATTNASGVATGTIASTVAQVASITFTANGVTLATTVQVTFTPTPLRLAFVVQPATYTVNQLMRPPLPMVQLQDQSGNPVTSRTVDVTVTLLGAGSAQLHGDTTIANVSTGGVAQFQTLWIDTVGTGYQLQASSPGVLFTTSDAFQVVASPAWTKITNPLLAGGVVNRIALDTQTTPHTLYSAQNDGVFVSSDGGSTWTNTTSNMFDTNFTTAVIDTRSFTKDVYVAGESTGIWKSSSHGAANTWTRCLPAQSGWVGLATTNVAGTLYAYFGGDVLQKTTDAGATWAPVAAVGLPSVPDPSTYTSFTPPIAVAPSSSQIVFVGGTVVWKSLDGGATFSSVSAGLPANDQIMTLTLDGTGANIYAGTQNNGVFQASATASSPTWVAFGTGLGQQSQVNVLAVDPNAPGTVYCASQIPNYGGAGGGGIYKLTGGAGAAWSSIANGLLLLTGQVHTIAIDPTSGSPSQTLFVGLASLGVFESKNAGAAWSKTSSGMDTVEVFSVAIDPSFSQYVYAVFENQVIWSEDFGKTFAAAPLTSSPPVSMCIGLAVDATSGAVYLSTDQGVFHCPGRGSGVFTQNTGTTFHGLLPTFPAVDGSGHVYIGAFAFNSQIYESTDGGVTFTALGPGGMPLLVNVTSLVFDGGTLYAMVLDLIMGNSGIYKSTNPGPGMSVTAMNAGLTNPNFNFIYSLCVDSSHNLYYADQSAGVFKFPVGGTRWQSTAGPLTGWPSGNGATAIAYAPAPVDGLYVWSFSPSGLSQGVWSTLNGGVNWEPATNGYATTNVFLDGMCVDTQNPTKIYGFGYGTGLYVTTTDGTP